MTLKKGTDKKRGIYICQGTGCVSGKSLEITEALKKAIAEKNLTDIEVGFTGCHGFCEQGPVAIVQPEDIFYAHVTVADVPDIVNTHFVEGKPVERLYYKDPVTGQAIPLP